MVRMNVLKREKPVEADTGLTKAGASEFHHRSASSVSS
jgi:hypothetical protein